MTIDELLKSIIEHIVTTTVNPEDDTREVICGVAECITKDDLAKIICHPDFVAIGVDSSRGGLCLVVN
jgi:hypothetical protein